MNFERDAQKLGTFDISGLRTIVRSFTDDAWNEDASRQAAFNAHVATQTLKLIADSDFRHTNPTHHPLYARLEPLTGAVARMTAASAVHLRCQQ